MSVLAFSGAAYHSDDAQLALLAVMASAFSGGNPYVVMNVGADVLESQDDVL